MAAVPKSGTLKRSSSSINCIIFPFISLVKTEKKKSSKFHTSPRLKFLIRLMIMTFCLDPSCRNQSYIVQEHKNVGLAIVQAYYFSNTFEKLGYFAGKTRGRGILINPANIFLTFWESNIIDLLSQ